MVDGLVSIAIPWRNSGCWMIIWDGLRVYVIRIQENIDELDLIILDYHGRFVKIFFLFVPLLYTTMNELGF